MKSILNKIDYYYPIRQKTSINSLLNAWIMAENPQTPIYTDLIEIYEMIMLDLDLSASWERRKNKVIGESFAVYTDKNKEDKKAGKELAKIPFLNELICDILDAKMFGQTLCEFYLESGELKNYNLIDRRLCVPSKTAVVIQPYSSDYKAYNPAASNILDVRHPGKNYESLGMLLKLGFWQILKKVNLQDWSEYNTNFLFPILVAKTDITDGQQRELILNNLSTVHKEKIGLIGLQDEIMSVATSASTGSNSLKDLQETIKQSIENYIEGANDEGRRLTGSTYLNKDSVSKMPAEEIKEADMIFVEGYVNKLLQKLRSIGYLNIAPGAQFMFNHTFVQKYADKKSSATNERNQLYNILLNKFDIPADYFIKTYGVELSEKEQSEIEPKQEPPQEGEQPDQDSSGDIQKKKIENYGYEISNEAEILQNPEFLEQSILLIEQILNNRKANTLQLERLTSTILKERYKYGLGNLQPGNLASKMKSIDLFAKAKASKLTAELLQIAQLTDKDQAKNIMLERANVFNGAYLEAEKQHAVNVGLESVKWNEYNDDDVLRYSSVGDGRVRPEHQILNGIQRKKSDAIWGKIWPPNGYRCRCTIINLGQFSKERPLKDIDLDKEVSKEFQHNFATSSFIFAPEHSYFEK